MTDEANKILNTMYAIIDKPLATTADPNDIMTLDGPLADFPLEWDLWVQGWTVQEVSLDSLIITYV